MYKKIILIFSLSAFLHANFLTEPFLDSTSTETTETRSRTALDMEIETYQSLVEKTFVIRVKALHLLEDLTGKEQLTGADLDRIHHAILDHLSIKDPVNDMIEEYQYLTEEADQYTEKERLERIMISLSAMLLRYDDYLLVYTYYENDSKLRKVFNSEDSAYDIEENTLSDMTDTYNDYFERENIKDMISFYQEHISAFEEEQGDTFEYLRTMIEQSPSYQKGFDDDVDYAGNNLEGLTHSVTDDGDGSLSDMTNELSKAFGNSAGLVETRKGKLYEDESVLGNVRSVIKAGDILLEKTPFRLTDKLIPGHWGHAAVYIGTADELKDLGIWEHPVVVPFHQDILDGKLIDEALRDGVQLNTVEHFMNIDDLAILRDHTEATEAKADRIILTLRQLGKEYDFNFDIETSDKIVCSELIYATAILIDWETEELLGSHTISPDNVAVKSIEADSILDIILLYHDGEEVTVDKKGTMQTLLDDAEEEE